MLKTVLVLPDGQEISSGVGTYNAVRRCELTECVNDDTDLSPGSVCANQLRLELITPQGGLPIQAGQVLTLYRQDDAGVRHKLGMFITQTPERSGPNSLTLTAYDRVSLLDTDLTDWLAGLTGWPYGLLEFARLVCDACGLTLKNEEIPNGTFPVQAFSAQGVTGRDLIRWAGQLAGRFCRADAEGDLEFAWYAPKAGAVGAMTPKEQAITVACREGKTLVVSGGVVAGQSGQNLSLVAPDLVADCADGALTLSVTQHAGAWYYGRGLRYADYAVASIEKVQLRQTEEDVGAVYPPDAGKGNACTVTGNYLAAAADPVLLQEAVKTLYEQLAGHRYTPCTVTIPASTSIHAGDILPVTDANGRSFVIYVMKKTQSGQVDTLECTGNPRRDESSSANRKRFSALSGKVLQLQAQVDGLKAENRDAAGNAAALGLTVDGITAQVVRQQALMEETATQLTRLEQDAQQVSIQIQTIRETGVDRVQTATGYTFDEDGLHIRKDDGEMENLLDNTGMYVSRAGQMLLQANSRGVEAADVTVSNYLVIGSHARLEDYSDGTDPNRTACFFL